MAEVDMVLKWQQSVKDEHHIDEKPPVSHLFAVCSEFYAEIVAQLGTNPATERGLLLKLQRSHSYLILWADGYGVAEGQLDASLDKSRRVKRTTINLLISICQILTKRERPSLSQASSQKAKSGEPGLLPALGREQQLRLQDRAAEVAHKVELLKLIASQDDVADSDSDSDTESGSSQVSDTAPDLDDIAEDLRTDTECLLDLGSRFKEDAVGPVVTETAVDPEELIVWDPSDTFVDRVRWRYPKCDLEVSSRLGRANWTRVLRQQSIKDMNQRKVEVQPDGRIESGERSRLGHESVMGSEKSKDTVPSEATTFRDSAIGSSIPSNASGPPAIEYAETTVSYYGGQGDAVRIPSLPAGAKVGTPFLCIGCNKMVTAPTKSLWKKHLFSDLKPYICLVSTCVLNEKPFATKSEWKDHMDLKHTSSQSTTRNCPVCQENTFYGDDHFSSHIAKHLEEVALTILPTNADSEDGTDADSGLASSESSDVEENEETEKLPMLNIKPLNKVEDLDIVEKIRAVILEPLSERDDFAHFKPWVFRIGELIQPGSILRGVEDALLYIAMETSSNAELYQKFSLAVLEQISKASLDLDLSTQIRSGERPYDKGYFPDAEKSILRRARDMEHTGRPLPDPGLETLGLTELDDVVRAMMSWRAQDSVFPYTMVCQEPGCGKEFKRDCDLTKHQKTHSRPWKCPIPTCKYREYGWPTEKELDRHWSDKHEEAPTVMYTCLFAPCPYKSKRESNCKQHMEKAHGWTYVRSKTSGRKSVLHNEDISSSDTNTHLPATSNLVDKGYETPDDRELFSQIGIELGPGYSNLMDKGYGTPDDHRELVSQIGIELGPGHSSELIPPPIPSASRASIPNSGLNAALGDADEDWTKITDLAERRRIQNRIAQRHYRKTLKQRLEDLEKRANLFKHSSDPLPNSGSVDSPGGANQLMNVLERIDVDDTQEKKDLSFAAHAEEAGAQTSDQ